MRKPLSISEWLWISVRVRREARYNLGSVLFLQGKFQESLDMYLCL